MEVFFGDTASRILSPPSANFGKKYCSFIGERLKISASLPEAQTFFYWPSPWPPGPLKRKVLIQRRALSEGEHGEESIKMGESS